VNDKINFYTESCKLAHANIVMAAAVKELLIEKYTLQEKVQYLTDYIRKIETQSKESKFAFK
jgi:hypothetical protein